jgi:hypothetical protein
MRGQRPKGSSRRDTHGVGRQELGPEEHRAAVVSAPAGDASAPLVARGDVIGEAAQQLDRAIRTLDPVTHPLLTLDLRRATALDPLVIHSLLHARQRRGDQWGTVRVLVAPGAVERFLNHPRFQRLFDIVHPGEGEADRPPREIPAAAWEPAQLGAIEHYHQMLDAARRHDAAALRALAGQAQPVCVASGAEPEGPASGEWCDDCPMRHVYGGCQPLISHLLRAAEAGNWEAAQLLVLALIAEVAGVTRPGQSPAGASAGPPAA